MSDACNQELDELFQRYLEEEAKIKKEWLEKHPEKMIRGSIAPVECRKLKERVAAEAKAIKRKYSQESPGSEQ